jgi:hypothetical protein
MNHAVATNIGVIFFLSMFLAAILYLVFGEVTVRRLRKDPETKKVLGIEFASGWDILNVAHALSWPRSFMQRLEKGLLSALHADSELIYKHTTKLDRVLGRAFYWTWISSIIWLLIWGISLSQT